MVATASYSGATLDQAVEELRFRFRGEVIQPGDEGYESGRHAWNGSFDRRPALIVRPADEVDVINAVRFARERGLPLAVRGGGHSVAGHSTCDGGIVVDLSAMNSVRIDPERRIARVQAGATWGEYAEQAQVYGLATSSGDTSSVGVGGLTLGGGMARVPEEETAFAHRDKSFLLLVGSHWEAPTNSDQQRAWTEEFWQAIRQYGSGVYVNFLGNEGGDRVREAYKPATYERLAAIKRRYDPTNLFSLNQNIKPA